jgi:hypothetical protein
MEGTQEQQIEVKLQNNFNKDKNKGQQLQSPQQLRRQNISDAKIMITDNLLLNIQKNIIAENKKKYILIRFFINKVLDPKSIFCLTDFSNVSQEIIISNVERNRQLLKTYSESYNKSLGIKSVVTKDTLDEKIKPDYVIKFIKMCLASIGYILVGRVVDKTSKPRKINYTIKLSQNLIVRM